MNVRNTMTIFKHWSTVLPYKWISKFPSFHTANTKSKSFKELYKNFWSPQSINQPPFSHITQIGDPVLRQIASSVPEEMLKSPEVDIVIKKLIDVMHKYKCVGLAAPQIGVSLRIFVMEFPKQLMKEFSSIEYKTRQMETLPLTVCINPELKITNFNETIFPEGCMSVRGYSAKVPRFEGVTLKSFTNNGVEFSLDLNGWNARIAQHELDHLNGKMYVDLMDRSSFTCTCWETVNLKSGRIEIPFYE